MSFGGSASGSTQQAQSQSSSAYNPQLLGLLTGRASDANAAAAANPYQAYSGGPLNINSSAAQGVSQFQPHSVSAQQITPGLLSQTNLQPYMNPFTQDVTNTTLNTLNQQQGQADQQAAGNATAQGAFGGDRSAVLQNLTDQSYNQAKAQTVAGLNQSNFTQAQGAAGQDIANQFAAAQANQGAGLQAGIANQGAAATAAGLRLAGGQQLSADQQAQYGAGYQQYLNQQNYPLLIQQMLNQSYGLLPTSPLSQANSNSNGSSFGVGLSVGGGK